MLHSGAVKRSLGAGETVAIRTLIVESANEDPKCFNKRFGFVPLTDDPMGLFLPLGTSLLPGAGRVPGT